MSGKRDKKVKIYRTKKKNIPESKIIEELQSKYANFDTAKAVNFTDLPLSCKTLKGLKENDYIQMTDIQRQSIGLALQGNDILGAAKTGNGKTLAFVIPVLEILYCRQWTQLDNIGALIITPTRELAYQIYETLRKVGRVHDISAGLIIGGKDWKFEKKRVDRCNIIICTPGRLLQHMDENPLFDCSNMQVLVLDEADRCLDMGFKKSMNAIIENLPPDRQTFLFSATQTKSVQDLARLSLKTPLYVSVHEHSAHSTPEGLQQSYVICNLENKIAMLWSFIRNHLKDKIIVFFNTCKQVKYIYESFCRMQPGISLMAFYGTLHQLRRMDIYDTFCKKQHAVLFATDIAARGLDFPVVDWVVQIDCPEDANAYIHRAGRTARLQRGGESLLVLTPSELEIVNKLEARKIPISLIKINPEKLQNPQRKLEALLARDVELKETAKRALVHYVKSVFLMKDKSVFNVKSLDTDAFARSMGLAIPPRIRFLEKMDQSKKIKVPDVVKKLKKIGETMHAESSDEESDKNIRNINEIKEQFLTADIDDDSDDDILTVRRRHVEIEDVVPDALESEEKVSKKSKKALTKAAVAKKILRKKIVPNKKTYFTEEGQEVVDSTKSKVSELAKQYEMDNESGINIDLAKQILREEDHFDKQRFRQKIKEKHKEEKKKAKAQKKATEEIEESGGEDSYENSESENGPDLSWLPDPDKIYGKENKEKEESDENEDVGIEEPDVTDDDRIDSNVHRPPKRKLISQEKHKKKRKRTSSPTFSNLQADEELALQLLQC